MEKKPEKIKWSPRIRPEKIRSLYESDAKGFQDDELCNDVGFRLHQRCQTIVMVSKDQVVEFLDQLTGLDKNRKGAW